MLRVTDTYYLDWDAHNWIVKQKMNRRPGSKRTSYKNAYFPRLEQAVSNLLDRVVKEAEAATVEELLQAVSETRELLVTLVREVTQGKDTVKRVQPSRARTKGKIARARFAPSHRRLSEMLG